MQKEINKLKRELVSRGDMKTIIKKLSQQDDDIRWLIENHHTNKFAWKYEDTPDYQKPPKLTLWQKICSILP